MKLVKSLLLGSAAGLCAVAGAQAADLPMKKSAPVEYVRVCTAYGAGFFYIPGTDTCLRIGGRARFEYQYTSQRARATSYSGFRGLGRLNMDARTQTPYGTLRAFVRLEIASRTGGYFKSGTQQRFANAFAGGGVDSTSEMQKYVQVDKAFIQFMGFTAGAAASFFDFYAHDVEMIGSSVGSDVSSTNLFAYTATFGGGFSATLSVEDPNYRRNPTFGTATVVGGVSASNFASIAAASVGGVTTLVGSLDVTQKTNMPDVVGVLRYDQPWGSAQISGAVHELRTGNYSSGLFTPGLVAVAAAGAVGLPIPSAEYGYAVQGGLKLNLPQLAPGDVLWLQAAYGQGANLYTGIVGPQGSEALGNTYTTRFGGSNLPGGYDMAVGANGQTYLTESYSGTIALLHYWTPELRSGIAATYGRAHFDRALRVSNVSPLINAFSVATFASGAATFSGFGKDYNNYYGSANLIWSPVRDLDIGVEAAYERIEFLGGASKGKVFDSNKFGSVANPRTISYDDNVLVRMRVQRDF